MRKYIKIQEKSIQKKAKKKFGQMFTERKSNCIWLLKKWQCVRKSFFFYQGGSCVCSFFFVVENSNYFLTHTLPHHQINTTVWNVCVCLVHYELVHQYDSQHIQRSIRFCSTKKIWYIQIVVGPYRATYSYY